MLERLRRWIFHARLGARRSSMWGQVRKEWLILHPTCAVCGTKKHVEVHHKEPFYQIPELELEPSNLITLCREHHFLFGHLNSWKSANPEVDIDSKIWNDKIKNRA